MPQAKTPSIKWINAVKHKNRTGQWSAFKEWSRTGKRGTMTQHTMRELTKKGLEYKEGQNRKRKKPYTGTFTENEKKEIERQVKDIIKFLYPGIGRPGVEKKAVEIMEKIRLIVRVDVEEWMNENNPNWVFDSSRMYLDALDPKNRRNAKKRGLERAPLGYHDGGIVLSDSWMKTRYRKTVVAHEVAHELIGGDEYKAFLMEFYYSLKRGIMTPEYLQRYKDSRKEAMEVKARAIRLYRLGKSKGWKKADAELRKELFG